MGYFELVVHCMIEEPEHLCSTVVDWGSIGRHLDGRQLDGRHVAVRMTFGNLDHCEKIEGRAGFPV